LSEELELSECADCGGLTEPTHTTVDERWGDELFVLEEVPGLRRGVSVGGGDQASGSREADEGAHAPTGQRAGPLCTRKSLPETDRRLGPEVAALRRKRPRRLAPSTSR